MKKGKLPWWVKVAVKLRYGRDAHILKADHLWKKHFGQEARRMADITYDHGLVFRIPW